MGGTSPLLFKLENFRTRFSPGLASERNRITCCIFVDRIERLESRVIKRISLPFPSLPFDLFKYSVETFELSFGQNFEISSWFRGLVLYRGIVLVKNGRIQARFLQRRLFRGAVTAKRLIKLVKLPPVPGQEGVGVVMRGA